MAERRVAEVVAETDRLGEILVQAQRTGSGARDLRDLERMGQARPVVVAGRRDEHLRLVLEPPERLRMDDPVTVALKRGPQPAVGLRDDAVGWIRAGRGRRQRRALVLAHARGEALGDGSARMRGKSRHNHDSDSATRRRQGFVTNTMTPP